MKSDWGISEGKMWETLVDGNILQCFTVHNGYNIFLFIMNSWINWSDPLKYEFWNYELGWQNSKNPN